MFIPSTVLLQSGDVEVPWLLLDEFAAGDGTTDDGATITNAIQTAGPTTSELGRHTYVIASPIIIPNGHAMKGMGAMSGGSIISPHPLWPTTTVNGGQTTPADDSTTFTLTVASTARFPLGVGGITPPGNVGVLCTQGITIFYTGTTPTTFTGCRVQDCDTNVTLTNARPVSTFLVWLCAPGEGVVGFGTRIDHCWILCNDVAGIGGIHSCHVQENAGGHDLGVTRFCNFGIRIDSYPGASPADAQAVNFGFNTLGVAFSASCEAEAVGIDYMMSHSGTGTTALSGIGELHTLSCGVVGAVVSAKKAGVRLNAVATRCTKLSFENQHVGIMAGDVYPSNLLIDNCDVGANWGSDTNDALIQLGDTVGNAARVRTAWKSDPSTVPNRKVLVDIANAISLTEDTVDYDLFQDGTFRVNGGTRVGDSSLRPPAETASRGATWFATDTGHMSICDGSRWYPIVPGDGIVLVQDNVADGARDNSAGSTLTVTFTKTTTIGSRLCLAAMSTGNFTLSTVTDSRGNTWAVDKVSNATQGPTANIASALVTIAHQIGDTLTLTFSGSSTYAAGIVSEFDLGAGSSLDKTGASVGGSSTPTSGVTATRTVADELLFGATAYNDAATETAGSGYTILTTKNSGAGNRKITPEYQVVFVVGTDAATWAGSLSNWEAAIATYAAPLATA